MQASQSGDPTDRPALSSGEVRKLQRFLRDGGAKDLQVDGELGPRTLQVAFDLFREGPVGLSDEMMRLLQTAAFESSRPTGITDGMAWRIPPVWIFYGNASLDADWVRGLVPGSTIFWIHGRYPRGGAYKRRLRAGDTVLFLVGQQFLASGLLLADDRMGFYDANNRVRRPVLVLDRFREPLSRAALEAELQGPAIRQGSVHPVSSHALDWFNRQLEESANGTSAIPA
jgi:hypothetical protein